MHHTLVADSRFDVLAWLVMDADGTLPRLYSLNDAEVR